MDERAASEHDGIEPSAWPGRERRRRGRLLTRSGLTIVALAVSSYLAGWQLGWSELMVFAAACLLAVLMALGFVLGRHRLDVTRTLTHDRVTVGDEAMATLEVTNAGRAPVGPRQLEDRSTFQPTRVDLNGLAAGTSKTIEYRLPTMRRGVIDIGPAVVAKADPLGLMRRQVEQAGVDQLWVQPRIVSIQPVPVGYAKDLEGPTSDTSPAGDVSFHTLREYSIGDDHRHVHWLSTARTGSLMVRHYVDNRRPHLTVVLDTGEGYGGSQIGVGAANAEDAALFDGSSLASRLRHRWRSTRSVLNNRSRCDAGCPGHPHPWRHSPWSNVTMPI